MSEMFDDFIPSTAPVNSFLRNEVGLFHKQEDETGTTFWRNISCNNCSGQCSEIYYDEPASIYTPQSSAPMTADEFFEREKIIEIVALPPIWLAEQIGRAMIEDLLPTALEGARIASEHKYGPTN